METILILDNLRSAANVGSIFRTADACGISHIILIGTTPCPLDRFGRAILKPQKEIAKVSLGAEKTIPWTYSPTLAPVLRQQKKAGIPIIALEQNKKSVDYKKLSRTQTFFTNTKVAIIVGNEPKGISKKTLATADTIAEIPMKGKKESFNVAVAVGIFLSRFLDI